VLKEQLVVLFIDVAGLKAVGSVLAVQEPESVVPEFAYPLQLVEELKLPAAPLHIVAPVVTGPAGLITTVVEVELVHPLLFPVSVYVPLALVVAFVKTGLNNVDVKPLGPVQLYVAFEMLLEAVKFNVCPEHTGLFEVVVMIGAAVEFIDTTVLDVETHPL
jgi:hypothetical protein